jgi:hypothetical protein
MSPTLRGLEKKMGASKFFLAFDSCFECLAKMDRCLFSLIYNVYVFSSREPRKKEKRDFAPKSSGLGTQKNYEVLQFMRVAQLP